jgi:cytochrome c oxidase subunit 4
MAHPPNAHQSFREEERVRHISATRYYVVWGALLALTALTLGTAKGIHLPHPWGLVVALVIAFAKATLVALFFMHLWDHGGANRLVLVTALVFLMLLMGLTLLDNATRFQLTNPPNDRNTRAMPPGPDILSPMVEPRGGLAPEPPVRAGEGAPVDPVRPSGSD